MADQRQPSGKNPSINVEIGGLFKGLGDLIERLSDLAEVAEQTRSGTFEIKGLGERGRGVYGFTVRSGIGGTPQVERFGNIRETESGAEVAEVREPLIDTFDEPGELVIVAELPGVAEDELQVAVQGDVLSLETTGVRRFAREILLPADIDPATIHHTYRNGILEIRFTKC